MKKLYALLAVIAMTVVLIFPASDAFARAGGGGFRGSSGSYGSRGSRSYSTPASPSRSFNSNSNTGRTAPTPSVAPSYPQSTGGGFMRGLMGGLVGGMLGSLLFSSLGFAGMGNTGGLLGGIGVFEIIIIGLGIFLLFRFMKSRRQEAEPAYYNAPSSQSNTGQYRQEPVQYAPASAPMTDTFDNGLTDIKRLDPNFSEGAFKEEAGDIFFKVQAAWTNRDLSPVRELLAAEINTNMRSDIDKLKREGRINRLENIAMREVNITEAWTEQGVSYVTVRLTASVLDYVTDETGKLIEGSKTEPIKFVEYWTYSKPIGQSKWQLSAIQQES
jgi:predicted lipid-binding transport protein (Tim44 family)